MDRESLKNHAVELRESGNLDQALEEFKKVIEMDDASGNQRGKMDALGHLRITYSRLAAAATELDKRKEYKKLAMQAVDEAISIGARNPDIPDGPKTIQQVHLANSLVDYAQELDGVERTGVLENALKVVNEALPKLPGSKAHKAWAANAKAQALYGLGRTREALETINQGEVWVYEGYEEEIEKDDQAEIKLNVWLSGLHLTMAKICQLENKPLLAKHYAAAVMAIEDPKGVLGERKKEALRILESLK